jgi:hypothetical protein
MIFNRLCKDRSIGLQMTGPLGNTFQTFRHCTTIETAATQLDLIKIHWIGEKTGVS